jgi:hypothetical protein
MTNPTSNFGWQMPTASDLVTDLPADFEVFGQAVDTSMADLKGGTTGQVLSKATNTNMDFTWVTPQVGDITEVTAGVGILGGGTSGAVTISNGMATAIDAKGDLIVGTGADTFARLAGGTQNQNLAIDTGSVTGLKWQGGAWITWSPTINNVTIGNGTITARYQQTGNVIAFSIRVVFGSTTTIAGSPNFLMPVAANSQAAFTCYILDTGVAAYVASAVIPNANLTTCFLDLIDTSSSRALLTAFSSTSPFTWGTGDTFSVSGTYEVA